MNPLKHKLLDQRLHLLKDMEIRYGGHTSVRHGACVMELVGWVAGETFSDHPRCACPVLTEFLVEWNDRIGDQARRLLKPLIPKLVGSRSTHEVERTRSWLLADWAMRVAAPMALDSAHLPDLAQRLRDLPEVTTATCDEARRVCSVVRDDVLQEVAKRAPTASNVYEPIDAALSATVSAYAAANAATTTCVTYVAGLAVAVAVDALEAYAAASVDDTDITLTVEVLKLIDRCIQVIPVEALDGTRARSRRRRRR